MIIYICNNMIPAYILEKYSSSRCFAIKDINSKNPLFYNVYIASSSEITHYAILDLTNEDIIFLTLSDCYIGQITDISVVSPSVKRYLGYTEQLTDEILHMQVRYYI